MQVTLYNQHKNRLQEELINLYNNSGVPLHFNKTGNKEFTNYQRISIIILFERSKKSLRDFVDELFESKWISWLGLKKLPKKSTLHDWLKMFNMKIIRKISKVLLPDKINLTAIDGTGFDSWQRSRHYEKKINEKMPYAKVDLFIDVKQRKIIDHNLAIKREHDAKVAKRIFRRNKLKGVIILGDKGYDGEPLHEIVRNKKGKLFAPVRKSPRKKPRGRYRRECVELPEFMGQRSIVESINYSLKKKQIIALSSKKKYMKQREFGWHIILYNIRMNLKNLDSCIQKSLNIFIFQIRIYVIPDNTG